MDNRDNKQKYNNSQDVIIGETCMLQICCIILSPLCSRYSFTVFTYLIFEVVTIFQNAILVHDLPWIAFIFYFQNVQEAKNVSLLLFTFNILSLKIVLEKIQNWTTNLAFYGYFTKCKCFKFANIHCMSTYVYLDGLSLAVCVSYRIYKKMRRNLLYLA